MSRKDIFTWLSYAENCHIASNNELCYTVLMYDT